MLTRIAIDNYRCFTNFEIKLNAINLLLGINGSGKTSLFQVLRNLQSFVVYQAQLSTIFHAYDFPRWSTVQEHKFELDFLHDSNQYNYSLHIAYGADLIPFVVHEELQINQVTRIKFRASIVELFGGSSNSVYPLEAQYSSISLLPTSAEYHDILVFRGLLGRMLIAQLMPPLMEAVSADEHPLLYSNAENFASWYRFVSQDQSLSQELGAELREIWPAFSHFYFKPLGKDLEGKDRKGLSVCFHKGSKLENGGNHSTIDYSFNELSDGQRALIAIYAILVYARRESVILCLDEPENYLALPEIQPWLIQLYDLCSEGKLQSILISHHPEVINYLGDETGIWLERPDNGPVEVHRLQDLHNNVELPMAELVARGWLDV